MINDDNKVVLQLLPPEIQILVFEYFKDDEIFREFDKLQEISFDVDVIEFVLRHFDHPSVATSYGH